jgi:hypothetical protein
MTTRVIVTNPDQQVDIEVTEITHGSEPNHLSTPGPGVTISHGASREFHVHQGRSLYIREKKAS